MLKLLVLAPGRSGTTSMRTMLEDLCRANGCDWSVQHQTGQAELTKAAELSILHGDTTLARDTFKSWTHQVEVSGNNNAFLIPVMREVFGADLKVIRLSRELEPHLHSMMSGVASSPEVWGGYHDQDSDYSGPIYWNSPTAPWFGEMSQSAWGASPTKERLRWYITTLHRLMDRGAESFHHRMSVRTEDLDSPETARLIAQFIEPTWTNLVSSVHQNRRAMYDFSKLTPAQSNEAKRLFGKFDFNRVLADQHYMLEWSLERTLEVADDPVTLLLTLEELSRNLRAELTGVAQEPQAS